MCDKFSCTGAVVLWQLLSRLYIMSHKLEVQSVCLTGLGFLHRICGLLAESAIAPAKRHLEWPAQRASGKCASVGFCACITGTVTLAQNLHLRLWIDHLMEKNLFMVVFTNPLQMNFQALNQLKWKLSLLNNLKYKFILLILHLGTLVIHGTNIINHLTWMLEI